MSAPVFDELGAYRKLTQDNQRLARENQSLKQGGGGGTSGGMEGRVSRLEARFDKMVDETAEIRVNLATLTERVSHLPSKGFIVSVVSTGVVVLGGVILAADRLKNLF